MRVFAGPMAMAVLISLVLPQIGLGQTLGPDAYFSSAAAAQQALLLLPLSAAAWYRGPGRKHADPEHRHGHRHPADGGQCPSGRSSLRSSTSPPFWERDLPLRTCR